MQGLELYISFLNIKKAVSSNPGDFYKAHTKEKLFYTGKKKKVMLNHLIIKALGRVTSNIIIQCDNLLWQKLMLEWFCNQKSTVVKICNTQTPPPLSFIC